MKKHNLLKAVGITFLIVVLLSWIIPAGNYFQGVYTALGKTAPLGIADLSRAPIFGMTQLAFIGAIFLIIGGIYGVLNKTGVYTEVVERVVAKMEKKGNLFLIITMIFFAVLSSLTGSAYVLFALVPFFVAVLMLLNYNKLVAFASTVGAMLVGRIASTYGATVSNYINEYFNLNANDRVLIAVRFVLLFVLTTVFILFVVKTAKAKKEVMKVEEKKETKTSKAKSSKAKTAKSSVKEEVIKVKNPAKDIPLYEENRKKKSSLPLIILSIVAVLFLLAGTMDWYGTLNISFFNDLHDKIASLEVLGYPLFKNILGFTTALGQWSNYEVAIAMMFFPVVLAFVYGLSFDDTVDAFVSGAKKMLPTAFLSLAATCVFVAVVSTSTGANMFAFLENWLLGLSEGFNLFTSSLVSLLSGFFYNDFQYAVYNVAYPIQNVVTDTALYPLIAIVLQTLHGLVMMIVPTSIFLIAGLSYLNISYKEWFQYFWKCLIAFFVILVLIFIVIAILI